MKPIDYFLALGFQDAGRSSDPALIEHAYGCCVSSAIRSVGAQILINPRSFLAGLLPISLTLSSSQLRLISTLGMGVLVGTSLIVIIPEGVETLYSATGEVDHVHKRSALYNSALDVRWAHDTLDTPIISTNLRLRADAGTALNALPGPVIPDDIDLDVSESIANPPKTPTDSGIVHALGNEQASASLEKHHREPHAWIGISLILGFILMYLIDTLPNVKPPPPPQRTNIYSLSDLSAGPSTPSSRPVPRASFSTTLGLVIHAAADGIALGASSTIPSISFIIFFAIMIHKAPAAFGLTSILLKQGLGKRQARTHLLAFSLAAPIGAILTWAVVRMLGGASDEASGAESMKFWTGVILIFSGGTFL